MRLYIRFLLIALCFLPSLAFSSGLDAKQAEMVCNNISAQIDEALGAKKLTLCLPASETKGGDTNLFVILARGSFDSRDDLAYWVAASVGVLSKEFDDPKNIEGLHGVILQDKRLISEKKSLSISLSEIRNIGKQMASGELKSPVEVLDRIDSLQANTKAHAASI